MDSDLNCSAFEMNLIASSVYVSFFCINVYMCVACVCTVYSLKNSHDFFPLVKWIRQHSSLWEIDNLECLQLWTFTLLHFTHSLTFYEATNYQVFTLQWQQIFINLNGSKKMPY